MDNEKEEPRGGEAPTGVQSGAQITTPSDDDHNPLEIAPQVDPKIRHTVSRKTPVKTALRFLEWLRHDGVRTLHYYDGAYWGWNLGIYERIADTMVRRAIYRFLCSSCLNKDGTRFEPKPRDVDAILHALIVDIRILDGLAIPVWLDGRSSPPPTMLLVCQNGLVDLIHQRLIDHTPHLFAVNRVNYSFGAASPQPKRWLRFLTEIWPDDPESIAALQELFGYAITSLTNQQKIFQLVGPPRSGRGTILRILSALVGEANVATPTFTSLAENFGMAPLIGKRLATFTDVRVSKRVDAAVIVERLLSVSGEDTQTINRKFLPAWIGKLNALLILVSNDILSLPDVSGALPSRMLVLRMTRSFLGKEKPNLTAELLEELSGILNWAIQGMHRLLERGHFIQPASARSMIEVMHEVATPIGTFVRECCDVGPSRNVKFDTLYKAYEAWCMAGDYEPISKPIFAQDIHSAVPTLRVTQPRGKDGKRSRFYEGIALKTGLARAGTRSQLLYAVQNEPIEKKEESGKEES